MSGSSGNSEPRKSVRGKPIIKLFTFLKPPGIFYYIKDNYGYTYLVDSGSPLSLLKYETFVKLPKEKIQNIQNENFSIIGFNTQNQTNINQSCEIESRPNKLQKFYIFDSNFNFDGLVGIDFLENLNAKIDYENKKLILFDKELPLYPYDQNLISDENLKENLSEKNNENKTKVTIPARTIQTVELNVEDTNLQEGLCPEILVSKEIKIPTALVSIKNNKIITTIANISSNDQNFEIDPILIEPLPELKNNETNIQVNNLNFVNNEREQRILNELRLDHLNSEEKELIQNLCLKYKNIFYLEGDKLTFTSLIKHEINTNNSHPIYSKTYRYPHIHKQEVKKQINEMLNQNIIQPSTSPWSSPVWVVPKKIDSSGKQKWRLVIDYRKLNEVTVGDKYPLPNIEDLLDQLGKCKYFSTIDLASGFHQIEIEKRDIPKTAFSVENGHFEFLRMPFGLRNAPSTFERVMDQVLTGIQNEICMTYLDDIITYSSDLNEHIYRLESVFQRLEKHNLKIQPCKCEFLRKEVAYLGHVVTKDGVKPNPNKIIAIQKYPIPKTQKEIKSFLGLTGYYRRFIKNYSEIIKPLTLLLKKNANFNFDEKCIESFNKCKELLTNAPILSYPNFDEEFILTTDASNFAIGAVLAQGKLGEEKPIAYGSRTLNGAETRYSTIEKELLSIVHFVKHFRPYLFGRKFKIVCDHKPLIWVFSIKDPGSRLARWRLKLEEYEYEIIHKPGKYNKNADALSRIKINPLEPLSDSDSDGSNLIDDFNNKFYDFLEKRKQSSLIDFNKIKQTNDNLIFAPHNNIILFVPINENPETPHLQLIKRDIITDPEQQRLNLNDLLTIKQSIKLPNRQYYLIKIPTIKIESLSLKDCFRICYTFKNLLPDKHFYINPVKHLPFLDILSYLFKDTDISFTICHDVVKIPPENERKEILNNFHSNKTSVHKGINETFRRIREQYVWKNLRADVENFIKSCDTCNKTKTNRQNPDYPLVITETPEKPFEHINIDLLDINRKNILLTIVDNFSKYAQAYYLPNKQAISVVDKLLCYFQHFPIPKRIHCDAGSEFDNVYLRDLAKLYNFKLTYSAISHPQSNGTVERFHATLLDSLRAYHLENPSKSILEGLPYSIISYNKSRSSTTKYTPEEIIYGHIRDFENEQFFQNESELHTSYINQVKNTANFIFEQVKSNINQSKQKSKERFDKHVKENKYQYKVGDLVYIKQSQIGNKMKNKFNGPYKIIKIVNTNTAKIETGPSTFSIINFDRLKLASLVPGSSSEPQE